MSDWRRRCIGLDWRLSDLEEDLYIALHAAMLMNMHDMPHLYCPHHRRLGEQFQARGEGDSLRRPRHLGAPCAVRL